MRPFDEYQAEVTKVPVSLRNNRQRIELPVLGLQQEAGLIGSPPPLCILAVVHGMRSLPAGH
jgi:hypothetical protein